MNISAIVILQSTICEKSNQEQKEKSEYGSIWVLSTRNTFTFQGGGLFHIRRYWDSVEPLEISQCLSYGPKSILNP